MHSVFDMLKEALEQSGVAGLIGWTDTADKQDNVFSRALVSKLMMNDDGDVVNTYRKPPYILSSY